MMRALIVDDEIYAREEMETLLRGDRRIQHCGEVRERRRSDAGHQRERPDVLFLDIQMPVINGFELLSMIDEAAMPLVVFVTAYDEYALKAFEENALDYLLKPVEKGRLAKTVEKLKRRFAEGGRPAFAGPAIQKIPCIHSSKIKLIDRRRSSTSDPARPGYTWFARAANFTRTSPSRSWRTRRTSSGATSSS